MGDLAGGCVRGVADVAALNVFALAVADVRDVELDVLGTGDGAGQEKAEAGGTHKIGKAIGAGRLHGTSF
jgi:hypothetical protein